MVPVLTLAPVPPPVEVHPDSPRAALSEFYKACEDGNVADAAAFLELRTPAERERSQEIASRLRFVLDKRLWVAPDELAADKPSAEKKAVPEELGVVTDRQGRKVPIRLTWSGPRSRWLFAYDTVKHIDHLFSEIDENWTRRFFPQLLTRRGPQKFEYWQWMAVPFILGAAWLVGLLARPFARRLISLAAAKRPAVATSAKRLAPSVGFVVSIGSAHLLFAQLHLYEPAQDFVDRWLLALFWLVVFHTIWRVARTVLDVVGGSEWAAHRPSARSFLPFASRAFGALVIFIGLASVLSSLGYNVTGLLTGLGIGGIAVALAAQKTVENLFGSFSHG
jgi:MscS family membrane protein